jgi:glycosyltransferase involved in cell wall biosynthesis
VTTKTKLCIVSPVHWQARMGGSQYQMHCMIERLLPGQRYDIHYLARRVNPDYRPSGYQVERIGHRSRMSSFGAWVDALPLYRRLRRIRPDVIYQRIGCGYTGIAAEYARRNGIRMVWHVASDADVTPMHARRGRNALKRLMEKRMLEHGVRHASHIVVQTAQQARLLAEHYGRQADLLVPNFHPLPREQIDKSGPITVLWIANLKPLKQPESFVRLAARCAHLTGVRFAIIGEEPVDSTAPDWLVKLRGMIATTPNLDYLGGMSQDEVNAALARAHLLVNTSQYEGFANTFVQAWLRQVPVISLHFNPDEVLERQGIGVHARTDAGLVHAIERLAADHALREDCGRRAAAYARATHSLDNVALLSALLEHGCTAELPANLHLLQPWVAKP